MEQKNTRSSFKYIPALLFILLFLGIAVIVFYNYRRDQFSSLMNYDLNGMGLFEYFEMLYGDWGGHIFGPLLIPIKGIISFITAICLFRGKTKGALTALITYAYIQSMGGMFFLIMGYQNYGFSLEYHLKSLIFAIVLALAFFGEAIIMTIARKKVFSVIPLSVISVLIVALTVYLYRHLAIIYIVFIVASVLTALSHNVELKNKPVQELSISPNQTAQNKPTVIAKNIGNADTLIKYKELLDEGIITEEEFNVKKKELLDL